MVEAMGEYETGAWSAMLAAAVTRHRTALADDPSLRALRSAPMASYTDVDRVVRDWEWYSTAAVLLPDDTDEAVRAGAVADLEGKMPWPPAGVCAAADGTWFLDRDLRVTRLG